MRNPSASKTEKPQRKTNNKENNLCLKPSPYPGFAQSTSSRKNSKSRSSEINASPKLHNKILQKPNCHPEWKKISCKKKLERCNSKIPTKDLLRASHESKIHPISINYIDSSNRLLNVSAKRIKQLKFVSLNLRLHILRLLPR
jgi:hypothetical protein